MTLDRPRLGPKVTADAAPDQALRGDSLMAAMFRRTRWLALALASCACVTALPACSSGVKVGPWQVVDAPPPLQATRIEIERWKAAPPTAAASHAATRPASTQSATRPATQPVRLEVQRLVLDLATGRGSFTDADGKPYPLQFESDVVNKIRAYVVGRTWQADPILPAKGAVDPTYYSLTVFNGDARVSHPGFLSAKVRYTTDETEPRKLARDQGLWADPPSEPLSEGVLLLGDTFDRARRVAHPLSNRVNLIQ